MAGRFTPGLIELSSYSPPFTHTIAANLSREEAALDELQDTATRVLGDRVVPGLVSHRVRIWVM